MFRVKICGVTTPGDAAMVAAAGADAIGLNFVRGSPRYLASGAATEVAAAIPAGVLKVGVFVGMPIGEMLSIADAVGLDAIQLHGPLVPPAAGSGAGCWDPPEACPGVAPRPVIRAVHLDPAGPAASALERAMAWVRAAEGAGRRPAMLLIDAAPVAATAAAAGLGGTGRTADWRRLRDAVRPGLPVGLAGGLHPGNVAEAIRVSGVKAVDTASGVESSPGRKDPARVADFVAAALGALAPPLGS